MMVLLQGFDVQQHNNIWQESQTTEDPEVQGQLLNQLETNCTYTPCVPLVLQLILTD